VTIMHILWILALYLVVCLVLVIKGPSVWDRLLGLSLVSTKVNLIIIVFASIYELSYLLDVAIVYTLLGFIGIIFSAIFLLERAKGGRA